MAGRKTLTEIFSMAREPSLTPVEKALWLLIRSYDSGMGCWAGDRVLAEHLGMSERTVHRAKKKMLETGYVTRELRGPHPARWKAVIPDEVMTTVAKLLAVTDDEARGKSSEASPRPSPSDSPLVTPEYVEYGGSTVSEYSETSDSLNREGNRNSDPEQGQTIAPPISDEVLRRVFRACPICGDSMPRYRDECEGCRSA